ncbi:AMP-dependent synthetase/ligase [Corchorus olitorius]|uniref:AMP-dependent synthetase/ligase n=1 Tax=Corchorus olitorius TaxID=93759 RepID=A0A1R3GXH9_9ROSI|nr:AMP-dependent synthetase/ligase [Corchorus olitorius]
MLDAIETHKVNNLPAIPPVILNLVKYCKGNSKLSSLRRIGSWAAPLSKELTDAFREQFPWIELRQGYGLTESTGATSVFMSDEDAKAHPGSSGRLLPKFCAKIVDVETGLGATLQGRGTLVKRWDTNGICGENNWCSTYSGRSHSICS